MQGSVTRCVSTVLAPSVCKHELLTTLFQQVRIFKEVNVLLGIRP